VRTNHKVSGAVVSVSMAIACPLGVLGLGARNTTDSHMEYQAASTRQQRQVSWLQHQRRILGHLVRRRRLQAHEDERHGDSHNHRQRSVHAALVLRRTDT